MRAQLLLALALAPTWTAPKMPSPSSSSPGGSAPAYDVRVVRGRATLVQGRSTRTLTPSQGETSGRGAGALGLGSGGRAELTWRSRASLRLSGPAEVEWSADARSADLQLIVGSATRLELEARRTAMRLELSHGWSLEVGGAALQLSEEPTGGWVIHHHGGRQVRVRSRVPRARDDWPRTIGPGEEVRLRPSERPEDARDAERR